MKLLSIGYNHWHDETFVVDRPTGIDTWLFLLIKTPAVFMENSKKTVIKKNSFVLYASGIPQYYSACSKEYIDDWFHFIPEDEDITFFKSLKIPLNVVIEMGDITDITAIVKNMTYEFYEDNIYKTEIVKTYYKLLFYKISQILYSGSLPYNGMDSAYFIRMQALRHNIYNHPQIKRTVDSMALELSMSRSAFQHNYKKIFGKSVLNDIITSRLQRVKFYLSTTDMTLDKIAQLCGYHNELHLIRQFKQHYGVTPTEFRQHL